MPWPEKCAMLDCVNDESYSPTVQFHSLYEGGGCCDYNGYLMNDGEYTYSEQGYEIQCCKGRHCLKILKLSNTFQEILTMSFLISMAVSQHSLAIQELVLDGEVGPPDQDGEVGVQALVGEVSPQAQELEVDQTIQEAVFCLEQEV